MTNIPKEAEQGTVALLKKLNVAVKAANDAEASVSTAQTELASRSKELVSRSKAVGLLLLKAKKLHPAVEDFKKFLKKVQGLQLSRAYDLLRLAGGRTTDEEIRKSTLNRVKKHRAKKLPRPAPAPIPNLSVTSDPVTESAETSAEKRKAENAVVDDPSRAELERLASASVAKQAARTTLDIHKTNDVVARQLEKSSRALAQFKYACEAYLPQLTPEHLLDAINHCAHCAGFGPLATSSKAA